MQMLETHPISHPIIDCIPCSRHRLEYLFAPGSIAVIGATEKSGSVGRTIFENLRNGGFKGEVFPVNPKHRQILGIDAYNSIRNISRPVDLAVIVTPAATVPELIRECSEAGVKGAVVISAGFKECSDAGRRLEEQIQARKGNMRIIGPNCLGIMIPHFALNATFSAGMALKGKVAFLSQSGALCTAVLDWSLRQQVGFSAFISIGSMLDVGWGDLLDYFGEDPHTESIICYMESIGDARKFLSAAREVSFSKPIIVIKVGHTAPAAKAAASHTGAMTGSDEVIDAAFHRAGVLRVDTIEELFDMAEVLAKQPRPLGPRLAIVTNAGGPGALATDKLIAAGAQLAALTATTKVALNEFLPEAWSHDNPVDILGDADSTLYARAIRVVSHDQNTDGVLVVLTPQAMTEPIATAQNIALLAQTISKPILASWMGGASLDSARAILNQAHIPTYDYPDAAANAFALMWRYTDMRRMLYERPKSFRAFPAGKENSQMAKCLIEKIRDSGRTLLTEVESKELLMAYGIPVVPTRMAKSENETVCIADEIGYPVVIKLFSKQITHKSDVGGVRLNLPNASRVRRAWRSIEDSMEKKFGDAEFEGVTVQPFITGHQTELILGSTSDSQFGPVLLFGAGGEMVEIMRDRAIDFPPLTETLARRLMARTRIYQALLGYRGNLPVDLDALAQIIVKFSHLVVEQSHIAEIEINPLSVTSSGILALDARVVLHAKNIPDINIQSPAIRAYPVEYTFKIVLKNGTEVTLRPIQPEDEEMLEAFHSTLSKTSVDRRYFSSLSLEKRVAHERLARICFADYARQIPLVAEIETDNGERSLIAVGRINRVDEDHTGELAIIVSDAWQNIGLGTHLLESLLHIGRLEKISRIVGHIGADNPSMRHLCEKVGFQLHVGSNDAELIAELLL